MAAEPAAGTLGESVRSALAVPDPGRALRGDSLRFLRTLAISIGIQGPTAGVIVGPAVLAGIVGGAGALAYLLGFVAMAPVAYAFVTFSRSFNTASSVYGFNGAALGPRYGYVSAWLLLLVYTSFAAAVYASTADLAQSLLASYGVHVWWVWLAVAGWALTMLLALASPRSSSVVVLACEGVAILLVAVVVVAALTHGGPHRWSAAPFETHGIALGALGLGVVNAFGAFSGFEGAATLGEESVRPAVTIPRAVASSLVLSAAVYVVVTWVVDNAYTSPAALAAAPAPLVHLAAVYVGPAMAKAINLAGVISALGAQLACVNAANRLVFALGREAGGGASATNLLVRVDRRRGAPVGALAVVGVVSLATVLAFSAEGTAVRALTLVVTYGAYLIVVAYLLTAVAAVVWAWRTRRRGPGLAVLVVGVGVLGYVLYDTFVPFPAAPFGRIVAVGAGSALLGLAISLVPAVHRRLGSSALLRAARRWPRPAS